jgi:hypothetical protein
MARQESLIKFTGKLRDVIGYKDKDNYLLRSVPGMVQQTPATKKAATDFGTASKGSRLIRHALKPYLQGKHDRSLTNRLNKRLIEIIQRDTAHQPGFRTLSAIHLLTGFQFNSKTDIYKFLDTPPVIQQDKVIIKASARLITLSVNFLNETTHLFESENFILPSDRTEPTLILLEIQSALDVIAVLPAVQ